jgi:TRAP-type C4-dicarboxylate transport system permease small subunit
MLRIVGMFDELLERFSRWGLIISLFVILGFAVLAIVLRWLGESPTWIDPLVRHMVFLSAFFGGSLATSKGVHIRIDLFSKLVSATSSKLLYWVHNNLLNLFCLLTTLFLMKAGWDFFNVEKEFGAPAFLHIHSSWLVAIVPFGLGLIALRFLNQLLIGIMNGENSEHRRLP